MGGVLSGTMLVACESAIEYWLALTWSPQAQWLRESERAGKLQARGGGGRLVVCVRVGLLLAGATPFVWQVGRC